MLGVDLGKRIPTEVGVVVFNVATVFAIHRAWNCGERLVERVVTVGDANAWLPIGHPVGELPLSEGQVIVGGPGHGLGGVGTRVHRQDHTRGERAYPAYSESVYPVWLVRA